MMVLGLLAMTVLLCNKVYRYTYVNMKILGTLYIFSLCFLMLFHTQFVDDLLAAAHGRLTERKYDKEVVDYV